MPASPGSTGRVKRVSRRFTSSLVCPVQPINNRFAGTAAAKTGGQGNTRRATVNWSKVPQGTISLPTWRLVHFDAVFDKTTCNCQYIFARWSQSFKANARSKSSKFFVEIHNIFRLSIINDFLPLFCSIRVFLLHLYVRTYFNISLYFNTCIFFWLYCAIDMFIAYT